MGANAYRAEIEETIGDTKVILRLDLDALARLEGEIGDAIEYANSFTEGGPRHGKWPNARETRAILAAACSEAEYKLVKTLPLLKSAPLAYRIILMALSDPAGKGEAPAESAPSASPGADSKS